MKKLLTTLLAAAALIGPAKADYTPTAENLQARKEFADHGFGIFIHWGIYSMFAQGEWYLNSGLSHAEYSKAASGFYPARFNAKAWVKAIKDAGAKYICFTSRHHDGFSMWDTDESTYNIVDATPFKRDILKELADECHAQGIKLHLYYSHIDWGRTDYPKGRTGLNTGCSQEPSDWKGYYGFMNRQLTELLTNYGEIGAIWFDGHWDHDSDSTAFDWELPQQYELIHKLQPSCLVGNNHHITPYEGEDIQIFERDLPGENSAGLSGQEISPLPLETCQTMNGMWGYKVADQNYKSTTELIHLLVKAAGMGANLLLNVGPQPNGELPASALERLSEIGKWMDVYGPTFYATTAPDFAAQPWGTATRKDKKMFVHVLTPSSTDILVPTRAKVKKAVCFTDRKPVKFSKVKEGVMLHLETMPTDIDHVIELETK